VIFVYDLENGGNRLKINEAIKIGLAKKNWSQRKFSKEIGHSPSVVSSWCRGIKIPYGDILIKIATMLDIVQDIFPGYEKKTEETKEDSAKKFLHKIDQERSAEERMHRIEERLEFLVEELEKLQQQQQKEKQ
jgi:transcriptional regulator with XRE-family HTH domain